MFLHKPFFAALCLLCYGMLTACASTSPPMRAATPATLYPAQTIAVPADNGMLAQSLRTSLTQHGWSLMQYDPAALQGSRGYSGLAAQARYRLTLSSERIGDCRSGDASFLYNIALIENNGGDVLIGLTGANCRATAIQRFESALERKQLTRPANGG